jgi:two-component system CheB/CheR fusion protein
VDIGRCIVEELEAKGKHKEGEEARNKSFGALLQYLRESRGFDFTIYKRGSLRRRVDDRMNSRGFREYAPYMDYLEADPDEFTHLLNALPVNVTSFFRDPDAWKKLGVVAREDLLATKPDGALIRAWSAGCASGEEVYSLAMLQDGSHVFRPDLRRCIIFERHNLLKDPPVSRVDLLVCRNTLMYFSTESQSRALDLFHLGLNDTGVLFLGKAEMLFTRSRLFTPIDLKSRIFRQTPALELRERAVLH